jgi:hypothetical protein
VIKGEAPYHLIPYDDSLRELEYSGMGLNNLDSNSEVYIGVSKLIQRFMGV